MNKNLYETFFHTNNQNNNFQQHQNQNILKNQRYLIFLEISFNIK